MPRSATLLCLTALSWGCTPEAAPVDAPVPTDAPLDTHDPDIGTVADASDAPGAVICGDGVPTSPEGCDDGNRADGDGCSARCTIEPPCDLFECAVAGTACGCTSRRSAPPPLPPTCMGAECDAPPCLTDADCTGAAVCHPFFNGAPGESAGLEARCLDAPRTSPLCSAAIDCASGARCVLVTSGGDLDGDGREETLITYGECTSSEGASCESGSECAGGEHCALAIVPNPATERAIDAPHLLAGRCVPDGVGQPFGGACGSDEDCASGWCLANGGDGGAGFCTEPCTETAHCPAASACVAVALGLGVSALDVRDDVHAGACVPLEGSLEDCTTTAACGAENEACTPIVTSGNPASAARIEHRCLRRWFDAPRGSTPIGGACPLDRPTECASGLCAPDGSGDGICTAPCGSTTCTGGTQCLGMTRIARRGTYQSNGLVSELCTLEHRCGPCIGHFDCQPGNVCVNLGTGASPAFRCVTACEDTTVCLDPVTACNAGVDALGESALGCFDRVGLSPVNHCD